MEKDYYKILGISDDEKKLQGDEFNKMLNKKFRALSLKYHPDKHVNDSEEDKKSAEEKFKEISEANTVLSDPKTRSQYDNGGMGDMNFEDFMSHFGFGGFGGFEGFSGFGDMFGRRQPREHRGSNIKVELTISLEEAFNGGTKNVTYTQEEACEHCHGTGSADGKSCECKRCNDTGMIFQRTQRGNMIMQTSSPCPDCGGTGTKNINPCKHCHGTGVHKISRTEQIEIPVGIMDGIVVPFHGLGNSPVGGGIKGDLLVVFKIKDNDYFKRVDPVNLVHYEYIPFHECILGFEKDFKTIDGSIVTVKANECTQDGKSFIFKGKGMPDLNNQNVRGDYAIVIKYKYPSKLNDEQREALKKFK